MASLIDFEIGNSNILYFKIVITKKGCFFKINAYVVVLLSAVIQYILFITHMTPVG